MRRKKSRNISTAFNEIKMFTKINENLSGKKLARRKFRLETYFPFKTTLDATSRNFQHKIIMGILPTNTVMVEYKIKDSPVWDLFNNREKILVHKTLFYLGMPNNAKFMK